MSVSSSPWVWCRLKDLVADMCLGKMLDKAKNQGAPKPYLGNINVRWFSFDLSELKEMRFEEEEIERFSLRLGDLVVCEGGEPGRCSIWSGQTKQMMIQKALHRIRFCPEVYDPRLAMYFLFYGTTTNRFAKFYTGTTIKHLTGSALSDVQFPLPPLPEQHRIVAKIEELFSDLDAGVKNLERAKANLKRYRASVLKAAVEGRLTEEWRQEHPQEQDGQMLLDRILRERRETWEREQLAKFRDKGKEPPKNWQGKYKEPKGPDCSVLPELPEGWVWTTMEKLLVYLRNGYFQSPAKATDGIPLLRINAVRPMSVDLHEVRHLSRVGVDISSFCVRDGDLLFTRYNGSVDLLGVAGMVRGCTHDLLHPDKLIRVVLALATPLPEFVEISANVGESRKHIAVRARTTAGQNGISGSDIREMPIPLPPLAEQEQIVALVEERLSQIDSAEKTINQELIRSKRLRQSILKRAFEGKLVPQDPNDEPASILLERIKASREAEQPKKKSKKATSTKTGKAL